MIIFYNQKKISDINILTTDPAIEETSRIWGKSSVLKKSSIPLSIFKTPFGSISLLYGPRQIGKTSSLKLFLSQVNDSDTLIFTDCSTILNRVDLYEHLNQLISGRTTLVLDEVQVIAEWHLALRSLYSEGRLKQCRCWCTGSEARYLLESGERLPGRRGDGKTVFARPWSFREYMDFFYPDQVAPYQKINFKHVNQQWLNDQKINLIPYWDKYLVCGGIPHALGVFYQTGEIQDSIWKVYVDWIMGNWSKMRTPERSLIALAKRLCETLNSRVSHDALKKGTDIQSPNTVKTLMEIQEDHFSIKIVPRYDMDQQKFLPIKLKKIYPLDPFIAHIWSAIGKNIRRLYSESVTLLPLDECAFLAQTYRFEDYLEVSYLYNNQTQSEIDFYFKECGFELKSNGNPSAKQWAILKQCPQSFVVKKNQLPLMAYLIGEGRGSF